MLALAHAVESYVAVRRAAGNTYWYLEAVPELMTEIADRCERAVMGGQP